MFARTVLIAMTVVLLAGCSGWVSESPLIPAAERDAVGLSGTYASGEDRLTVRPAGDGLYVVTDESDSDRPLMVAFDLLREEAEPEGANGEPLPRTYLMEVSVEGEERHASFYDIIRIDGGDGGASGAFTRFEVLCSAAAKTYAQRVEDKFCMFDNYTRLRAASLDAVAWYDTARMRVSETEFTLLAPEGFDEPAPR